MTTAQASQVLEYYDQQIVDKVADFVDGNRRVDAAWRTIQAWAPAAPRCVVEIGCGLGAMAYRMAARWPGARVIGVDISPRSIAFATQLFTLPNLLYSNGAVDGLEVHGRCDLVVLVDVFEHVARQDRAVFLDSIAPLLARDSRLVLTFPTPAYQQILRDGFPDKLQPVDEDVDLDTLQDVATSTGTRLLMFQEQSIWLTGDYAHAVLGRRESGLPVERPAPPAPTPIERVVRKARTLLHGTDPESRDARLEHVLRVLGPGAYRPR
jgi:SAM-dependent methyltransferase